MSNAAGELVIASSGVETMLRRCVSVAALLLFWLLLLISMPVVLGAALVWDVFFGRALSATRSAVFFLFFLTMELLGVLGAVGAAVRRAAGESSAESLARHYTLQRWWGDTLARGGIAIFGLNLQAAFNCPMDDRPLVLLVRHSSVLDTLLAVHLLSARFGLRLRYVLKKELLWDPCLDLVGNRLPNYFVDRKAYNSELEIDGVRALAENLGPGEGVLIYPEGTRFTRAKRSALLRKFVRRNDARMTERVEHYRHVLPPRLGGTLALLEACPPDARVVICAHRGFEPAASLAELLRGGLTGSTIDVDYREARLPDARDRESLTEWLLARWDEVDAFVDAASKPNEAGSHASAHLETKPRTSN